MATSSLTDMENPGGDDADDTTAQDTAQPSLPAGGAPAGGGNLGSILGRALAVGLAGFAPTSSGFQNLMMKQVMNQQDQEQKLAQMAGIGKAVGAVNQHLTNGDLASANAAYRELLKMPGAAGIPQVWALGKGIQDRAADLRQRELWARIAAPNRVTVPGKPEVPGTTETTEGEPEQPAGNAEQVTAGAPVPAPAGISDLLRSRMLPGAPTAVQPTATAPDATLDNRPSITTSTPGTPATPARTVLMPKDKDAVFNSLVAAGMDETKADRLAYGAKPETIEGPFGSKLERDWRHDTIKVITPGSLKASPGETFSLVDFNSLVNGKPAVTQIASGGAKPVTYADLDVKDRSLLPLAGTTPQEFNRLATSSDPADQKKYSDVLMNVDLRRAIRDGDPKLTEAAVSAGVNPQELAVKGLAGLSNNQIASVHGALQDFKVQEQTNALTTSERLKMQQPVLVAMPQLGNKMLVTKDGKFNLIEPSAFGTGAQFTAGYDPNKFAIIDAKEKEQLELLNATTPLIGGIKRILPEIYKFGKDHPGATLGQFVEFYAKNHTGTSPELAALGSLNVGLAAEITRATTGGTRPAVQVFNKVTDVDTPSWKDSIDTAVRKVDTAEQTIDVRRRSLTHMPVGEIDPTRPIPGFTGPPMQKNPLGFNVPTR